MMNRYILKGSKMEPFGKKLIEGSKMERFAGDGKIVWCPVDWIGKLGDISVENKITMCCVCTCMFKRVPGHPWHISFDHQGVHWFHPTCGL